MSNTMGQYTTGLIYVTDQHLEPSALSMRFQRILTQFGHELTDVQPVSSTRIRITAGRVVLEVGLADRPVRTVDYDNPVSSAQIIVSLTVETEPSQNFDNAEDRRALQAELAQLAGTCAAETHPDYVQWLHPDTVLDAEDFLRAARQLAPRRKLQSTEPTPSKLSSWMDAVPTSFKSDTPDQADFPDVESSAGSLSVEFDKRHALAQVSGKLTRMQELRRAFEPSIEEEAAMKATQFGRVASWTMAAAVGVVFLPLALLLAALNVIRGEDARLTSQIIALSGLFLALNASGAMADMAIIMRAFSG